MRLQILVTQKCNALCLHCDKAVGYAKLPDLDLTAARLREYVDLMHRQGTKFLRVTISGGEPILNPELQQILWEADRIPGAKWFRLLTNDLNRTKSQRNSLELPSDNWHWQPNPLDDSDDPLSGKNKPGVRYKNRVHAPFWISPKDIGLESTFEQCGVRVWCGKGLDARGFSMCGQAPIIGRLLGIDPYPKKGSSYGIKSHITRPVPEICEHCIYGCSQKDQKRTFRAVWDGKMRDMSPTYERVFPNRIQHKVIQEIGTDKLSEVS